MLPNISILQKNQLLLFVIYENELIKNTTPDNLLSHPFARGLMAKLQFWDFFSLFFSPFRECSLFSECGRFVILGSACYLPDEPHPPMVYIPKINFTSFFQHIFLHFDFTSFFLLYYFPSTKYIVTMKVWLPIQEILWKITPFIVLISKLVSIVIVSSSRMTKSF